MPVVDDAVSIEEHLGEILERIRPLPASPQPLLEAVGLPVVGEVTSPRSVPIFDNSAMDGYAVRYEDVSGCDSERPVHLTVIADVHAGDAPTMTVGPGQATRIMTGAPMPPGADTVVPVEATDGGADRVEIREAPTAGQHVRPVGDDVREGDVLMRAGDMLGPRQLGLLAAVGIASVEVPTRPRVLVMSTGAELMEPGEQLRPGAIYDSNSYLLTAAVRATGARARRVNATADDPETFLAVLGEHLQDADLVITSGGVSKGTRDVVKMALRDRAEMVFRPVRMQPGKPQGFGFVGPRGVPIFTLPGNPVSSFVSFEVFVAPALRRMAGRSTLSRPLVPARITETVRSIPGKRQFLRGWVDDDASGLTVAPVGGSGSHLMGGLGAANALIVLGEDVTSVVAGDSVSVMLLDRDF